MNVQKKGVMYRCILCNSYRFDVVDLYLCQLFWIEFLSLKSLPGTGIFPFMQRLLGQNNFKIAQFILFFMRLLIRMSKFDT